MKIRFSLVIGLLITAVLALAALAGSGEGSFIYLPYVVRPEALPTATPTPTATATQQVTAAPTNTPTPTPTQSAPSGCTICTSNVYNCSDFSTQAEAQTCHDYCWEQVGFDVHRLDADDDGEACESLPLTGEKWQLVWP